jgi:hypothetical protein
MKREVENKDIKSISPDTPGVKSMPDFKLLDLKELVFN